MKNYSIVLITLSSLLLFCFPSLASHSPEREEIFWTAHTSAEPLKDVVACDAKTNPLLYYVPVDEVQCEVPIGYGIDFDGTLEIDLETVIRGSLERLSLFSISLS